MRMPWTNAEKNILNKNYALQDRESLEKLLPGRTYIAIKLMSRKLGLNKDHKMYRNSDLSVLLEESHLAYYWIGFLIADGHFSKENRLQVCLGILDKDHLIKFSKFIGCDHYKINKKNCSVSVKDIDLIAKIKQKFDIHHQKTYNPPKFEIQNDELFLSFLAGFIDGDGSIRNQTGRTDQQLSIKLHGSWLGWLEKMSDRINELSKIQGPEPKLNKQGYSRLIITNLEVIQFLKRHVIKYGLPVLARKWDKIDLNRVSRYREAKNKIPKIKEMLDAGYTMKYTAKFLHTTYYLVKQVKESS